MSSHGNHQADYLRLGDWNAQCYMCGRKFKASELIKTWQGYWVCRSDWEARQPQDFVKSIEEHMTPPWAQPQPEPDFVTGVCTTRTSIIETAVVDCSVVDYVTPT